MIHKIGADETTSDYVYTVSKLSLFNFELVTKAMNIIFPGIESYFSEAYLSTRINVTKEFDMKKGP